MPVIMDRVVFRIKLRSQGFQGPKEISGSWGLDLSRHVTNATQGVVTWARPLEFSSLIMRSLGDAFSHKILF